MGPEGKRHWLRTAALVAKSAVRRYPRELLSAARGTPHTLETVPLSLPHHVSPNTVADAPLAAAWLGHATTLLKVDSAWVITDPVLSPRIGMPVGKRIMGLSRRLPLIDLMSLPPIDLVLISHAHFDHLDRPTLRALAALAGARERTRIITAPGTSRLIPKGFAKVDEITWDKSIEVGPLRVTAVMPRHWGARTFVDQARGVNSYFIRGAGASVFFAGDTALTDSFRGLNPTLSIFGIGAYDPWQDVHATPEEAWRMHTSTGAAHLMPVHHRTFELSDEPFDEPMERLHAYAGSEHSESILRDSLAELWLPGMRSAPTRDEPSN